MNLLLDTHALLWWFAEEPALTEEARLAIEEPDSRVFISPATTWEIAIKQSSGRLEAPTDLVELIEPQGFEALPITVHHSWVAGFLPRHHSDPFDRMLIAQALVEGLTVITRDARMALYGISTIRA